ncbi:M28 family metallopeptidase [Parachitinimonas caeni]|uniref:M28 family metallopeptidase n=1 Tax=Parachitinimonas caeni TaxID=3031301 RepID=A0ABT7DUE4_9NEIS|nr:M28 family metallopeptidase [Parachitinimonas caeni]MDK2123656.1 M28 family metallopeptidase [Parachitinimonas caeni]
MQFPFRASVVVAALLAAGLASAATPAKPGKVWITVGDKAYKVLQTIDKKAVSVEQKVLQTQRGNAFEADATELVHVVQMDAGAMEQLSEGVHENLHRCGGYMVHNTLEEARAALQPPKMLATLSRPTYKIDDQTTINPMLTQAQDSNIADTIVSLSTNFVNRYYTTSGGKNASDWIANKWRTLANGRSDVTVEQFTHANWPQKSVIATIKGTDNSSEVLVLGGHLDSINQSGTSETTKAPGADDDASGIASLTEAYRVMMANNYKPRRTIKFMAYAAEEVGLRGSADIAKTYKAQNVNVVGVMQLDMTNYKGSDADIYIYTDYTDAAQNQFLVDLAKTYLPTLKIGYDKCGYACSDHASWTNQGYPASLPFESSFNGDDPYIHTVNDTFANTGNQALHALKFARLALAYAVELGNDGPSTGGGEKTETFNDSVAKGANKYYGPFKVQGGTTFKAGTTGTGDADLYVRIGAQPTTSSYNCRPYLSGSTENCSVNVTSASDVYVMVRGYSASTYTLTTTYTAQ